MRCSPLCCARKENEHHRTNLCLEFTFSVLPFSRSVRTKVEFRVQCSSSQIAELQTSRRTSCPAFWWTLSCIHVCVLVVSCCSSYLLCCFVLVSASGFTQSACSLALSQFNRGAECVANARVLSWTIVAQTSLFICPTAASQTVESG